MNIKTVKKLEELIHFDENKIITGHKTKPLTAPGDNYGSLMLSVDIAVKTPKGTEEIQIVAKMIPPNEFMQEMFNSQVTFFNEIGFYKTVVPTLQNFQREHGVEKVIDFFPKYYGSRLNLSGDSTKVDSDAVLLLENLKVENYVNVERTHGFDLEASKLIITDLAHLHAVPLALKLHHPEVFENNIKRYLSTLILPEQVYTDIKEKFVKLVDTMVELKPFAERIHRVPWNLSTPGPPREPFATVSHNDCWVNNTMIQFQDGKPIKNKLVDFQICDYGSPAKDILFFLFSSVQSQVLEKYYDYLIKLYHETFTSILLELKCDITQFTFEYFQNELDCEAKKSRFVYLAFMLFPIFAPRGSVTDFSDLKPSDIGNNEPTHLHKQKLVYVVNEFVKRNWI